MIRGLAPISAATLRGTALLALDVVAPGVQRAPVTTGTTYEPRAEHADHYAERRQRFAERYDRLGGTPTRTQH